MTEPKTDIVTIRFTPAQREFLEEAARLSGHSLSEYIRWYLFRSAKGGKLLNPRY